MTDATMGAPEGQAQPSVRVLAQYVKDLSFENPRAPLSLQTNNTTPAINIGVNVGARNLSETDFEVTLSLECTAGKDDEIAFQAELAYAGVIRVGGMKPEHVQPFLLIEGPRLLFPFARQIIADAVRNGGFPPLMIDPIDFVALYRKNLERAQSAQQQAPKAN
ncbi:protein-export chaperone SecB [Acuticoccus yangtzensis]|uniref:protein-export chaperone SecB n=1 Tax=Acuticoccus yangtzensis TaxID=1443441 RepID=UPI0009497343|nr:protein-export chaperone SecB [Acuticoccus yangtzensis]ORE93685.1 preprotein translocase subunit SecB [Stappia sp. 22II-S9-Z10]